MDIKIRGRIIPDGEYMECYTRCENVDDCIGGFVTVHLAPKSECACLVHITESATNRTKSYMVLTESTVRVRAITQFEER